LADGRRRPAAFEELRAGEAVDGNGDSIRAQLTDGGNLIENAGSAKTFDLRLLVALPAVGVASRTNLSIDAASAIQLRPSDWSAGALPTAPIQLDTLDKSPAKVVKTISV
jgi:hypothetical protein